jgi:hypothetical protein
VQLVQKLAANLKSVTKVKGLNFLTFPVNKNPALDEAGLHVCNAMQSAARNAYGMLLPLPHCDEVITLCVDLFPVPMPPHKLDDNDEFFNDDPARDLAIITTQFVVKLCKDYGLAPVIRSARAARILRLLFGSSFVNSPNQAATAAGVPFTLSLRSAGSDIVTLLSGYGTRPDFPNWTVSGQFRAVRSRV